MPVHLTILGSGSAGNCAYLEAGDTRLLIDAGLSGRQIRQRLASIGRSLELLTGILITHEHTDHIQGLGVLAAHHEIPVYANRFTHEAIGPMPRGQPCRRVFDTGATFEIGEVKVQSFSVPHDAQDPVGFVVHTSAGSIGFLTDLGHATRLVIERVSNVRVLLLEANHDVKMLQNDPRRPWSTKQRILSRHGHLSNDAAAAVAEQIVTGQLENLYLGHLSQDCNCPELACQVVGGRLAVAGAHHVRIEATSQRSPSPTLTLA